MPIKFWTAKETKILIRKKKDGLSFPEIAKFVDRTPSSVKERWYWINRTEQDKEERRRRMAHARRRPDHVSTDQPQALRGAANRPIPAAVLEDRRRRLDAPRSLSAVLLGDPPLMQSALAARKPA